MPATWDETRVLAGEVGRYIVVARRSGKRWFVGAITGDDGRTLDIPLGFLGGDGLWKARIVADSPEAWVSPERADEDAWTARPAGKLTARMVPGGGFVAILEPSWTVGGLEAPTVPQAQR